MATINVAINDTAYTLLASGDNIVQNRSTNPIRLIHSATPPAAATTEYFILDSLQAFVTVGGLPSGDTYARADEGEAVVVVGV